MYLENSYTNYRFCMVRPRGGPMIFSEIERLIILGEVKDLIESGADGLVFGALTSDGTIDEDLCRSFRKVNLELILCLFLS